MKSNYRSQFAPIDPGNNINAGNLKDRLDSFFWYIFVAFYFLFYFSIVRLYQITIPKLKKIGNQWLEELGKSRGVLGQNYWF